MSEEAKNLGFITDEEIGEYKKAGITDEEIEAYRASSLVIAKSYFKELNSFALECAEDYGIDLDILHADSLDEWERLQDFPFWRLAYKVNEQRF